MVNFIQAAYLDSRFINPSVTNALFLYPQKTSEILALATNELKNNLF